MFNVNRRFHPPFTGIAFPGNRRVCPFHRSPRHAIYRAAHQHCLPTRRAREVRSLKNLLQLPRSTLPPTPIIPGFLWREPIRRDAARRASGALHPPFTTDNGRIDRARAVSRNYSIWRAPARCLCASQRCPFDRPWPLSVWTRCPAYLPARDRVRAL